MTYVDHAEHTDRHVIRRCDVCGLVIRVDCYPRTGVNQTLARRDSAIKLSEHLHKHTLNELLSYVKRKHQVG